MKSFTQVTSYPGPLVKHIYVNVFVENVMLREIASHSCSHIDLHVSIDDVQIYHEVHKNIAIGYQSTSMTSMMNRTN